jgi:hypothetical protein
MASFHFLLHVTCVRGRYIKPIWCCSTKGYSLTPLQNQSTDHKFPNKLIKNWGQSLTSWSWWESIGLSYCRDIVLGVRNPRVPCHSLPHIDLTAWKETPQGCHIGGRLVAIGDSGFPTPCTSCICTVEGVSGLSKLSSESLSGGSQEGLCSMELVSSMTIS